MIFAVLLIAGIIQLPESPRYLLSTGQYLEGEHVVAALSAHRVDSEETQQQKRIIIEALESIGELKIKHVFTNGPSQHLRRTLIGASTQLFQQIGGCNAVIYFAYEVLLTSLNDLIPLLGLLSSTLTSDFRAVSPSSSAE